MSTTHEPIAYAHRTTKGKKTIVEVTLPDGTVATVGGARAERANYAMVFHTNDSRNAWIVHGLRAALAGAESEVNKLRKAAHIDNAYVVLIHGEVSA